MHLEISTDINSVYALDYTETNRIGDHIWWISDVSKFASHYPAWHLTKTVRDILSEIHEYNRPKWKAEY